MQQRQLRLGDILDDYCPRERRITNHAIVAMIEDEVRQTRCTTCDAEHVYKSAKVPQRRRKDASSALFKTVLAGMPEPGTAAAKNATAATRPATSARQTDEEPTLGAEQESTSVLAAPDLEQPADAAPEPSQEEGPVHRPLIRATLPRPEGQPVARPAPEFTVRRAAGRNGNFRQGVGRHPQRPGMPPGGGRPPGRTGGVRFSGGRPPGAGQATGRPAPFAQRSGPPHSNRPPLRARHARPTQPPRQGGKKRSK